MPDGRLCRRRRERMSLENNSMHRFIRSRLSPLILLALVTLHATNGASSVTRAAPIADPSLTRQNRTAASDLWVDAENGSDGYDGSTALKNRIRNFADCQTD